MKFWNSEFPFKPKGLSIHYGWVVAVVGCMGMLASLPGQTIGVNVFNEKLIVALGLTRTNVSAAYFAGTALSGFLLPFAGSLFDRFGARRMIVVACLGLAASLCFISGVDVIATWMSGVLGASDMDFWIRCGCLSVAFFFIRFWGQGMLMLISRNMIGKWWVTHRGKVFSFGGVAVAVSFSMAPKIFDGLIESIGWREAWWLMAFLLVPCFCLLGWLLYRDNPDECELSVDAGLPSPSGQLDDPEFRVVKEYRRSEALRSYSFWAFSLVFALQACYFTGYSFHVVDVATDIGMEKSWIFNLFFPTALVSACVSFFVGWACDRWRLKYLLAFMAFGNALAPVGLVWGDSTFMPVFIIAGFGIGSGCFAALSGTFIPRFFGLTHLGAISGFFMSLIVLGSAVGPMLFSVMRASYGSYEWAHWLCGGASLVLVATAFFANNPQRALR